MLNELSKYDYYLLINAILQNKVINFKRKRELQLVFALIYQ